MSGVSILILVVTQGERDAVMRAVRSANGTDHHKQVYRDHTVFQLGRVGGAEISLAQSVEQGGVGPAGMMLTAASLLRSCRPDYLILVGICYGLREDEQRIGDILVSRNVQELDHQRVVDGPSGATIVLRRGARVHSSVLLLDRFNAATIGRARPVGSAGANGSAAPEIHFGLMLSANTLVDSRRYRENCKAEFPDAIGGDMEGAALYAAAAKDRVDWIVVKGIADWGYQKTKEHQDVAAANAAEFVVRMLTISSMPPRTPRLAVTVCD